MIVVWLLGISTPGCHHGVHDQMNDQSPESRNVTPVSHDGGHHGTPPQSHEHGLDGHE